MVEQLELLSCSAIAGPETAGGGGSTCTLGGGRGGDPAGGGTAGGRGGDSPGGGTAGGFGGNSAMVWASACLMRRWLSELSGMHMTAQQLGTFCLGNLASIWSDPGARADTLANQAR